MQREPLPKINFSALAEALLRDVDQLLPRWLPGGAFHKPEYVCGSLSGGEGKSCSVNVVTGLWSDFSTGEGGRDLLSLYAAIHDLSQAKAAVQVAHEEGLQSVANIVTAAPTGTVAAPPRPPPPPKPPDREKETWTTLQPVPAHAVAPSFRHPARKPEDIDHTARYEVGGVLWGFVVRFIDSDGEKVTIPYVYSRSDRDGTEAWKWRHWSDPRPLYFPGGRLPEGRTVVLVEGERKADCLQALLEAGAPGVYCVVSWPGGSNAWAKADWTWLAGSTVIAWPDCDSLREKLTREEVKATPDPLAQEVLRDAKPFLAAKDQPGQKAMLGIGALLRDAHGCTVQLLPVEKPGVLPSGWDCRDAIETDGWDFARVQGYFATARALLADVSAPVAAGGGKGGSGGKSTGGDGLAGAGGGDGGGDDDGDDPYGDYLDDLVFEQKLKNRKWLRPRRSAVIEALRHAPGLAGSVAFDELRDKPVMLTPFPWRKAAGQMMDQDPLRLAGFIESRYGTGEVGIKTAEEALSLVADENRFHPFRDWVRAQVWDKKPRLEKWLIHILGLTPDKMLARRVRYLEMVGKFIVMGHVARVMDPGCKFDYSVVLEGKAGMGKSTLVGTLVGKEFFSDTHFDIGGGKDGMEQLCGVIAYELSEMTAFRRADSEAVKAFFSSEKDRFRGAYGRYVQDHPRQCVIWCTTNKRQYLFDITGNRRFWPVSVDAPLNMAWLLKYRGQLFAEALHLYESGVQYFPTIADEATYFKPEQDLRMVETSVQGRLWALLTRSGAPASEGKITSEFNQVTAFVTIADLVQALGADPGKSSALLESQVRDWLIENGWEPGRESKNQRRRGYFRPAVWPPKFEDEETPPPPAHVVPVAGGDQGSAAGDVPQWTGGDDYAPI